MSVQSLAVTASEACDWNMEASLCHANFELHNHNDASYSISLVANERRSNSLMHTQNFLNTIGR